MRLAHVAVQRFEVEVQLAKVLGRKRSDLEFDRHQAVQTSVEEKQVQREVLPTHLHRVFRADVAEVAPQLGQEPAQVLQQAAVQVTLGMQVGQCQKVQQVGVLEVLFGLWLHFSQRC